MLSDISNVLFVKVPALVHCRWKPVDVDTEIDLAVQLGLQVPVAERDEGQQAAREHGERLVLCVEAWRAARRAVRAVQLELRDRRDGPPRLLRDTPRAGYAAERGPPAGGPEQ